MDGRLSQWAFEHLTSGGDYYALLVGDHGILRQVGSFTILVISAFAPKYNAIRRASVVDIVTRSLADKRRWTIQSLTCSGYASQHCQIGRFTSTDWRERWKLDGGQCFFYRRKRSDIVDGPALVDDGLDFFRPV
jgi:hypothetical protein